MGKAFKLGEFFGITAMQLAVFQPKDFDKLLGFQYTERINEGIYSIMKEIEFLLDTLDNSATSPDFDSLSNSFRYSGFLGLSPQSKELQTRSAISKFDKFYRSHTIEEVREVYGSEADDIISAINAKQSIDLTAISRNLSADAKILIKRVFDNRVYLQSLMSKCKAARERNQYEDVKIADRYLNDILKYDIDTADDDKRKSCIFCGLLYKEVNRWHNNTEHKMEYLEAIKSTESKIVAIQNGYNTDKIIFNTPEEVDIVLESIFQDISLGTLCEILEHEITDEQANDVFEELDKYYFGGLGLNGYEMSRSGISEMKQDNVSWSKSEVKHNDKLDSLMKLLYIDLNSKKFMNELRRKDV